MSVTKKSEVFVYIAGKYSDKTMIETERHSLDALELSIRCAENGVYYFCPHWHSKFLDFYAPGVSWDYWMDLDLRVINDLANCMIMVHNYKDSKGAKIEETEAKRLNYPVFYSFESFFGWYSALETT